jgi:hypothetical protein
LRVSRKGWEWGEVVMGRVSLVLVVEGGTKGREGLGYPNIRRESPI